MLIFAAAIAVQVHHEDCRKPISMSAKYRKKLINEKELFSKSKSCAVFLDLAKAFDLVHHNMSLKKIQIWSERGCVRSFKSSLFSLKGTGRNMLKYQSMN